MNTHSLPIVGVDQFSNGCFIVCLFVFILICFILIRNFQQFSNSVASFPFMPQVKEIEIAVDEKELQKEAALKEKEKELQALRIQLESLSESLQSRNSEASRSQEEQASKVSNLLAELQKVTVDKKGK